MSDSARRLAGPLTLGAAAATVYTVPADTTAIVKSILLCNPSGATRAVTMSVGADATGTRFLTQLSVPAAGLQAIDTFVPLAAGETLQAFCDAAGTVNLLVGGIETT